MYLKAKPFYLNEEDIARVQETLASMTLEQKAGQVFCPRGFSADPTVLRHLICDIGVGGMMYRPRHAAEIQNTHADHAFSLGNQRKVISLFHQRLGHANRFDKTLLFLLAWTACNSAEHRNAMNR